MVSWLKSYDDGADRGGDDVLAEGEERLGGGIVGAGAGQRHGDERDGRVVVHLDLDRVFHLARGELLRAEVGERGLELGGVDVVGLDGYDGGKRAAGEGGLDPVVGLHDRNLAREARDAGEGRVHPERREGQEDEEARRGDGRDERAPQHAVEDGAPEAGVAALLAQPVHERDLPLLDAVAEPGEERREHGQRAGDGDGDDHDRPDRDRRPDRRPAEEEPCERDEHGQPGDEDGPAGRGRRGLERCRWALAGRPLLALALEVEERVVDADRQADQEDDRGRGVVHGDELARDGQEAEGGHDGREAEEQRNPGGDSGAEVDQQDAERQWDGRELRPLKVGRDRVVDRLLTAGGAEALDGEAGVRGLDAGDGLEDRLDAVDGGRAAVGELVLDEDGVSVRGDERGVVQRRADLGDAVGGGELGDDVGDDGLELGARGRERFALDEDGLVDRVAEAAAVDDLQRAAGVAGLGVGGIERLGADHAAERDGDEHEGEPPEDRDLPVGGAPAAHAGCEVLGLGERGHGFLS